MEGGESGGDGDTANHFSYGDFQLEAESADATILDMQCISALERQVPQPQSQRDPVRRSIEEFRFSSSGSEAEESQEEEERQATRSPTVETSSGKSSPLRSSGVGKMRGSLKSSLRRSAMSSLDLSCFHAELRSLKTMTRAQDWLRSFKDLDPRYQILEFFNELSLGGVELFEANGCSPRSSLLMPRMLRGFIRSGIFSVWRPTSSEAIRMMITGEGTGKGLDIKGKSAKRGVYSGFVPFLQIHDNEHKKRVGSMREDKRIRVFYPNRSSRDTAVTVLSLLGNSMHKVATTAKEKVDAEKDLRRKMTLLASQGPSVRTRRETMFFVGDIGDALRDSARCFMNDPTIYKIDDYAKTSGFYGIDIPEKLFWEGYVVPNDITREKKYMTGRPSMPEFQQMNLDTLRKGSDLAHDVHSDAESGPRPALFHAGCGRLGEDAPKGCNPMCPIGLLMAYEEHGKVTPVVSDFDCFLLGTRGVKYHEPLGERERLELSWCVDGIEDVLRTPKLSSGWTTRWLEVKKKNIDQRDRGEIPVFGFADPRYAAIMRGAVRKLQSNGAVRHGPECFNYCFPQELDEEYLVISDEFAGIPWRYTNVEGLIDILCEKIDKGYTLPLNPKWVLCDQGWRRVYDKLWASKRPNVQDSLNIWYPNEIRERIDEISAKYPNGFVDTSIFSGQSSGVRADLAQLELQRYKARRSSYRKLKTSIVKVNAVTVFGDILEEIRNKAEDNPHLDEAELTPAEPVRRKMRSRKIKFSLPGSLTSSLTKRLVRKGSSASLEGVDRGHHDDSERQGNKATNLQYARRTSLSKTMMYFRSSSSSLKDSHSS